MAVYTKVPRPELEAMLQNYDLGALQDMREIMQGVENSNYDITTSKGRFILTLYERRVDPKDLPGFIRLMQHAAGKNIPCPLPLTDRNGVALQKLCGRDATIISFLNGGMTNTVTPAHCKQLGEALARFHLATADFGVLRENALSLTGWEKLVAACLMKANNVAPGLAELIGEELAFLQREWPEADALPGGVIHADLFPDNVFFEDGKLCGLIDFYFSCNDFLMYDLAVCINSWCFEDEKVFSQERMQALLDGYQSARPLSSDEKEALPVLLRGAALRFLLTRLYDKLNQPEGAVVKVKDPLEYRDKLLFFRAKALSKLKTA